MDRAPLDIGALKAKLAATPSLRVTGRVLGVTGISLRFALPGVRIGDVVIVNRRSGELACEVVAFAEGVAVAMPLGSLTGVGPDDEVVGTGSPFVVRASKNLLGRVVDGLGRVIDGGPEIEGGDEVPVDRDPPRALDRKPVAHAIETGVRAIDACCTLGEGQRIGLFSGSGVGKSTLLGAVARGVAADVVVVGLVGERGREVGEFLEHALGADGRARSIVVVATSDAPALERLRAAQCATAYAEYFRDQGLRVMLLIDSITRVARAQREIGLAAGEPPTRRGFPPSAFALLPRLLERAGQSDKGSITAIYTVLVEGNDIDEPVADEARGVLDGHIVLSREIAGRGRFPAIDITTSLSRVMDAVVSKEHAASARKLRSLIATYEAKRDLLTLGAYEKGGDLELDDAIAKMPKIEMFLRQEPTERAAITTTVDTLARLVGRSG